MWGEMEEPRAKSIYSSRESLEEPPRQHKVGGMSLASWMGSMSPHVHHSTSPLMPS